MSRHFRLWAYSPSHGRLVVRALADESSPANTDHIFIGVQRVHLPETMIDLRVEVATPETANAEAATDAEIQSGGKLFVLTGIDEQGAPVLGSIIAAAHEVSENDLAMFETIIDEQPPEAASHADFEKLVLAAVSRIEPPWIPHPPERGFDFFLDRPEKGRELAIEAKWLRGPPSARWIRSTVVQITSYLDLMSRIDRLVLVFGGVTDPEQRSHLRAELEANLTAALGGRTVQYLVAAWEDQSQDDFVAMVRRLLTARERGGDSKSSISPSDLRERFVSAVSESGSTWTTLDGGQPFVGDLTSPSGAVTRTLAYLRNVTHGGGERRPASEYRIQIANLPPPTSDPPGSVRLVLGWFEDLSVFAGFDAARHFKEGPSPSSVQVSLATLIRAHELGFATQTKGDDDVVCAFQSDRLGSYAADPEGVHAHGPLPEQPAVEDAQDAVDAIVRPARASSQGLQQNHAARLETERYAMQVTTDLLQSEGWTIIDVSKTASYDLRCTRDGQELRVEVKGTTGLGEKVLLTANEVAHARQQQPNVSLFVVSAIELSEDGPPVASGGTLARYDAWSPADTDLKAVTYSYRVPIAST